MKKLFSIVWPHIIFIVLTQIMYLIVGWVKPAILDSWWIFFYTGICLFIYLAAGWMVMHETQKRLWTVWAGLLVFYIGYAVYGVGALLITPLWHHLPADAATGAFLRYLQFSVYYALIAVALSFIGGHLCRQKQRFQDKS